MSEAEQAQPKSAENSSATAISSAQKEKLAKWKQFSTAQGISGEWLMRQELGEENFSEEEIHWVSEMFGR